MTRRGLLAVFILVLISVLWAAYYYVLDGSIPRNSSYPFDLEKIRALADAPQNQLPTEIRTEFLARTPVPYFALRAGGGFGKAIMARSAFQIVVPNGHYVLEAGMDLQLAEQYDQADGYSNDVWSHIQDAMSSSAGIIVTHEHPDHIGGIVRHRDPSAIAGKILLTKEQYRGLLRFAQDGTLPPALQAYRPIQLEQLHRIAPGIVMIRAQGHTPGSVIFYVKTQSGTEFLFIGDIAYTERNVADGIDRPRFVRAMMVDPEDRDAIVNQLRMLHNLSQTEPRIVIIPSHADALLRSLLSKGSLTEGFVH